MAPTLEPASDMAAGSSVPVQALIIRCIASLLESPRPWLRHERISQLRSFGASTPDALDAG